MPPPRIPSSTPNSLIGGQLSIGEVASLTGLSKATLWRLWDRPDWLDHCEGTTLRRLIAVFPVIGQHLQAVAVHERLDHAIHAAVSSGLSVEWSRVDDLRRRASPSAIATVVEAATAIEMRRASDAWRLFSLCWGAEKDIAVDGVMFADVNPIFAQSADLVDTAADLIRQTTSEPISGTVGYNIVVHKLVKAGALPATVSSRPTSPTPSPFEERSRFIGEILSKGETNVVDHYLRRLRSSRPHRVNEAWSMATYFGDVPIQKSVKDLPQFALRRTGAAIAADLVTQDNAYVYYLTAVAIGRLLAVDPHLGGQRLRIADALAIVCDRDGMEKKTIDAVLSLRMQISQ